MITWLKTLKQSLIKHDYTIKTDVICLALGGQQSKKKGTPMAFSVQQQQIQNKINNNSHVQVNNSKSTLAVSKTSSSNSKLMTGA